MEGLCSVLLMRSRRKERDLKVKSAEHSCESKAEMAEVTDPGLMNSSRAAVASHFPRQASHSQDRLCESHSPV